MLFSQFSVFCLNSWYHFYGVFHAKTDMCAMRASVVYVPTCHVPMCQKRANFSFLRANKRANVPKACQLFNLACQLAKRVVNFQLLLLKGVPIFQLFFKRIFQFLNFSILLNICKFQEYLGNSRKFISRNKEFKF